MSGRGAPTLEQVLARIHAEPVPDASALADIPLDELERQLAALGVDLDGDVEALLQAAGIDGAAAPVPLEQLDAEQVLALPPGEVEQRLRDEGVDVNAWLSRAQSLIRRRPVAAASGDGAASSPRVVSGGAVPVPRRRRRALPTALAASLAAVAVGGMVFTMVHEGGLTGARPDRRPGLEQAPGGAPPVSQRRDAPVAASLPATDALEKDRAPAPPRPAVAVRQLAPEAERPAATVAASEAAPRRPEPLAEMARERGAATPQARDEERKKTRAPGEDVARLLNVPASAPAARAAAGLPAATGATAPGAPQGQAASAGKLAQPPAGEPRSEMLAAPATAASASVGRVVDLALRPGQGVADALEPVALDTADRRALLDLLGDGSPNAAGRLRLVLDGARVREATLERGADAPIRVVRTAPGTLARAP